MRFTCAYRVFIVEVSEVPDGNVIILSVCLSRGIGARLRYFLLEERFEFWAPLQLWPLLGRFGKPDNRRLPAR